MQELGSTLKEKYDDMKESAKDLALMVKTLLDEEGFYLQYPQAAEILLKYLRNLNEKINIAEDEKSSV